MSRQSKYLPLGSRVRVKATLHYALERNDEGAPIKGEWQPTPDEFEGILVGVTRVRSYEFDESWNRTDSKETVYLVARNVHRRARARLCDVEPLGKVI